MDNNTLEQFSQQLGQWISQRLDAGTFPFRRVETTVNRYGSEPAQGAGLILWINRDSLLAGGLILFPDKVDEQALAAGRQLAAAYGLGQFVTWGARQVSLWRAKEQGCEQLAALSLPGARQISPADFATTLDSLLVTLKANCVSAALPAVDLPAEYFVRLCTLVIKDLEPQLNDAALQAAGANRPDSWTATAPRDKAWLSLWRLLLVLWHDRLVPGIQPERLEQAMTYALADICHDNGELLLPTTAEPPLVESAAIRFHQLGGRLRQLGWCNDPSRTLRIIELLLRQVATSLGLPDSSLLWPTAPIDLSINLQRSTTNPSAACIAPHCYLAGQALLQHLCPEPAVAPVLAERVAKLPPEWTGQVIVANLLGALPPPRAEQERRQIELRMVWPNRRFHLPKQTPSWVWEAMHLCGLGTNTETLHLLLPADWSLAPGIDQLWELLSTRYRIIRLGRQADGSEQLQLAIRQAAPESPELHRQDGIFLLNAELLENQPPGFLQLCMQAPTAILELIIKGQLRPADSTGPAWADDLEHAVYLFTRTTLGQTLWRLCGSHTPLPDFDDLERAVKLGLPLPSTANLAALASIDWRPGQTLPPTAKLDRKLAIATALTPEREVLSADPGLQRIKRASSSRDLRDGIIAKVFQDGVPRFPEHYLMAHFRPQLQEYLISGPLRQTGLFFDRIELCGADNKLFNVRGAATAEALVLLSQTGCSRVNLPADPALTEQLLDSYRQDLHRLWEQLVRECRRHVPRQQAALTLARRLWREQDLPPVTSQPG